MYGRLHSSGREGGIHWREVFIGRRYSLEGGIHWREVFIALEMPMHRKFGVFFQDSKFRSFTYGIRIDPT